MLWHVLTPEYPPDCGGVSDYTAMLASALADAGDLVHVWHPPSSRCQPDAPASPGVAVHQLPDRFGRASRSLLQRTCAEVPGTILVQYVPSAFGLHGGNVPFCRWVLRMRRAGADVRVMFHEPFFYFGFERPWRNALAITQRLMASLLIRGATTLYFSTENWFRYLEPFGPVSHAVVTPVPSTVSTEADATTITTWRDRVRAGGRVVVGHFGTYGDHVGDELRKVVPEIWRVIPDARVLLIGEGSAGFAERMSGAAPLHSSLAATGRLPSIDAAAAMRACDVLIAPYPDGVTTRRTSVMAALTSGRAVVTTDGPLTEPVWRDTGAVALVGVGDAASFATEVKGLVTNTEKRVALGARGRQVYDDRFDLSHTISVLRGADVAVAVP